jgi:hypothetical protein
LFRIVATEAHRFPELAARMRENNKRYIDNTVAQYMRTQVRRGSLSLADPDRAARLFLQMISSEVHESLLFDTEDAMARLDLQSHLEHVIDIFLLGATPRGAAP